MLSENEVGKSFVSVTNFVNEYCDYKDLYKQFTWDSTYVGESYTYPESVHSSELHCYNGVVFELFMRKCICRKYGVRCVDKRTEKQLWFSEFKSSMIKQQLSEAYEAYRNPSMEAINILDQIKMVALSHRLAHDEQIENVKDAMAMEVNICNLKSIMKYVEDLQYKSVRCKERCALEIGNVHMIGVPDYIFDDNVICHMATSMHETVYTSKITKTIFYVLGHYNNYYYAGNITQNYNIIIYNPLLGLEHKLNSDITPKQFSTIVNDLKEKIKNVPQTLDPEEFF